MAHREDGRELSLHMWMWELRASGPLLSQGATCRGPVLSFRLPHTPDRSWLRHYVLRGACPDPQSRPAPLLFTVIELCSFLSWHFLKFGMRHEANNHTAEALAPPLEHKLHKGRNCFRFTTSPLAPRSGPGTQQVLDKHLYYLNSCPLAKPYTNFPP